MKIDEITYYFNLLELHQQGYYTHHEVISKSIDLLFESVHREAFWQVLEPQHRESITQLLNQFDKNAKPFAIRGDPQQIWHKMSALRQWLIESNLSTNTP